MGWRIFFLVGRPDVLVRGSLATVYPFLEWLALGQTPFHIALTIMPDQVLGQIPSVMPDNKFLVLLELFSTVLVSHWLFRFSFLLIGRFFANVLSSDQMNFF